MRNVARGAGTAESAGKFPRRFAVEKRYSARLVHTNRSNSAAIRELPPAPHAACHFKPTSARALFESVTGDIHRHYIIFQLSTARSAYCRFVTSCASPGKAVLLAVRSLPSLPHLSLQQVHAPSEHQASIIHGRHRRHTPFFVRRECSSRVHVMIFQPASQRCRAAVASSTISTVRLRNTPIRASS